MDTLERALKVWGKDAQMLQVIEEMSELTKEILKNVNRKKIILPNLLKKRQMLKLCWSN